MVGKNPRLRVAQEDDGMTALARTRTACAGLALSLALVGCGGDDDDAAAAPTPTETAVPFQPTPTEEPEEESELYVVTSGDTLSSIALRFDTTVDEIVELNDLDDADTLAIGDELRIPATRADEGSTADTGTDASADASTDASTDSTAATTD